MAKRFIDTDMFDDSWFMELSKDSKLLWVYMITKCNHAGIIEFNKKLWEFHTGLNSLETLIKELGNRLIKIQGKEYYFIPKFLLFQYPKFPNSKVRAQDSAIKILENHGINHKDILTVSKPLTKDYDNDNDNVINSYIEEISKSQSYLDGLYMTYKLRKGSAGKLLNLFKQHLKMNPKEHGSFSEFRTHFNNWLNVKDSKGQLNDYKINKKGSL